MNKTAIKNYAVGARRKLMEAVRNKAYSLHVYIDGALPESEAVAKMHASGLYLDTRQLEARRSLCKHLAALGESLDNEKAYAHMLEEVAYTWFNRLIAIRFMEVNDYLPSGVRVLSSVDKNRLEPDCVREWERLDYVSREEAAKLKSKSDEALYRYLLIAQCKALQKLMPGVFGHISDYTELLLPDRLYTKDSIVYDLTHSISEEDFGKQVEIIGWLYQYYISEKKDEVFAQLKKNVKITKENIPAATQLFTPDWIVKYMVENSLGRLWLEYGNIPLADCGNVEFRDYWNYYIDEAEQSDEVEKTLKELRDSYIIDDPTKIKFIDPCMGSGHILVYAFDVLYMIYLSQGYAEREIPDLILQNNLFGLDIDERACQLAYFALMMKARSYNRRFFRRDPSEIPVPQVFAARGDSEIEEYGSALKVNELGEKPVLPDELSIFDQNYDEQLNAWNFRRLLSQKYDCVVTNPPYMGSRGGMNNSLYDYINSNYPDSKADLYSVFIEQCKILTRQNGLFAMITQQGWMFLTSFVKLRSLLLQQDDIINMLHLGPRAFDEINGEVVQSVSFVMRKSNIREYRGTYCRLLDGMSEKEKEKLFLNGENRFSLAKSRFLDLNENAIAYWLSENMFNSFRNKTLGTYAKPRQGMATSDNNRFLRFWSEVNWNKVCLSARNEAEAVESKKKWFPYNKGGGFRKWFGNNEYLINWENNGQEVKALAGSLYRSVTRTISRPQILTGQ